MTMTIVGPVRVTGFDSRGPGPSILRYRPLAVPYGREVEAPIDPEMPATFVDFATPTRLTFRDGMIVAAWRLSRPPLPPEPGRADMTLEDKALLAWYVFFALFVALMVGVWIGHRW